MQQEIKKACEILRQGGIILYPTNTIWGIGCDATNGEAVQKIKELKQRDVSKSMLVLLDNPAKLPTYVSEVPDIAWDLIELADKPLTIIYSGAKNLAQNLVAADGTIDIRITTETFSAELCKQFRKPIVSTSANISGDPAPDSFKAIGEKIKSAVDYVVQFGQEENRKGEPSGIIKLDKSGTINIIRK